MTCYRLYTALLMCLSVAGLYLILKNINASYAMVPIPDKHIVAVLFLYISYYMPNVICLSCLLKKNWWLRALGILGIILLYRMLFPWMYWLIQVWLPTVGVQLFNERVAYDELRFHRQLSTSYVVVIIATLGTVGLSLALSYLQDKRRLRSEAKRMQQETAAQQQQLAELQRRVIGGAVKSHFIHNILSTGFGEALLSARAEQRTLIRQSIDLLGYFMRVDREKGDTVELKGELGELERFLMLMDTHYGTGTLICDIGVSQRSYRLPLGLLLLPLENVLKYARLGQAWPVYYQIVEGHEGLHIRCINKIDPIKVATVESSGTGIQRMKEQIALLDLPISIAVNEQNEHYIFEINIKADDT